MELGGGNSNLLYFHPEPWGKNPQFWQNHIFSNGFLFKTTNERSICVFLCGHLDGGFKYFLFSSLPGVSWSNLTSIFFRWVGSTTNQSSWCPKSNIHLQKNPSQRLMWMHEPRPMCGLDGNKFLLGRNVLKQGRLKKHGHGGEGNDLDIVNIWWPWNCLVLFHFLQEQLQSFLVRMQKIAKHIIVQKKERSNATLFPNNIFFESPNS